MAAHFLKQTHVRTQTTQLKGDLRSCKNTLNDEELGLVALVKQHLQHVPFMFSGRAEMGKKDTANGGEWLSILDRH